MHMQGAPRTMQDDPRYDDVVAEVHGFLVARAPPGPDAGVREVWLDPGIGFGKTVEHNLALLRHLPELVAEGFPVLVGTSRKSFLGRLAPGADGRRPPPSTERLAGITRHRHLGHAGGRVDGAGPRRGRRGAGGHARGPRPDRRRPGGSGAGAMSGA